MKETGRAGQSGIGDVDRDDVVPFVTARQEMSPIIDDCPNSGIAMVSDVKGHEQVRRFHFRGYDFHRVNSFELRIGSERTGSNSVSTAAHQSFLCTRIEKNAEMSLHLLHV